MEHDRDQRPVTELVDAVAGLGLGAHHLRAATGTQQVRVERMGDRLGDVLQHAEDVAALLESLTTRLGDMTAIVAQIDGIASQTRLLALNAAIEAARAGEHGRGFAVVADEVRKLSDKSAQAVESVRAMIEGVRHGAGAEGMAAAISQVAGASQEQAAAARELAGEAGAVAAGADAAAQAAALLAGRAASAQATANALGAAVVADAGAPDAARVLDGVGAALAPLFDVPREHAGRFLALLQDCRTATGAIARDDLAALDDPMRANLDRFAREICGATLTVAPRLLADTELWMQWWARGAAGLHQLRPQLDRTRPGFYDYTADEWFTVPTARRRTWLSDPYFDEGGADADIVTISVPALLGDDVVAIATVDLALAAIGTLCAPALSRLAAPAALVGEGGLVVATNAPQLFTPGQKAHTDGEPAGTVHRSPALDWALLVA